MTTQLSDRFRRTQFACLCLCILCGLILLPSQKAIAQAKQDRHSPAGFGIQSDDNVENLGQFRISEFSLSPRLRVVEPGQSSFEIQQTWLGFEWQKDTSLRGVLWLGSSELVQAPVWYNTPVRQDFGIVEAWLEGRSEYGDLRAGLLNVHQGFEGLYPEWSWRFPESLSRRNGWLVKRDFGVQTRMRNDIFLTELSVHNGEAGSNQDGRMWVTGVWQIRAEQGAGCLMTAAVGRTRPSSTENSAIRRRQNFNFVIDQEAKIRYGTLACFYETDRNLVLAEFGRGELLQEDTKSPYAWGRGDIAFGLSGDAFLLLRYEQTQAQLNNPETIVRSGSLGLSFISRDKLQSVTIIGQRINEFVETPNDELLVIFRLNSRYLP